MGQKRLAALLGGLAEWAVLGGKVGDPVGLRLRD
jgi:hypothetical protein